jgi:hypothetical protein
MASQSRKFRGYKSQRIVATWLRVHGWPHARAIGAGESGADIVEVLDIEVEVKARRGFSPLAAMNQQARRADGRLPFTVLRMDGQGEVAIAAWPVVIRLDHFTQLLNDAGYGDTPTSGEAPQ